MEIGQIGGTNSILLDVSMRGLSTPNTLRPPKKQEAVFCEFPVDLRPWRSELVGCQISTALSLLQQYRSDAWRQGGQMIVFKDSEKKIHDV